MDGTFICDRLDGITQEGCKQTSFSKLSPIYLLIPILRPDVYKFQLQLQKKKPPFDMNIHGIQKKKTGLVLS